MEQYILGDKIAHGCYGQIYEIREELDGSPIQIAKVQSS
jgi:hypothetical protein